MCEPEGGGGAGPAIVLLAAAVAGGYAALQAVAPFAEAAALTVLALCAVGSVLVFRLFRYGSVAQVFRWHRRVTPRRRARLALTAGQRMIEQRTVVVTPGMILRDAVKEEAR